MSEVYRSFSGARHTELAPRYLTHPISTTSFKALIISSGGTSGSMRWICSTSIYVPSLFVLACTASRICLRDNPTRFTIRPSLIVAAYIDSCGSPGPLVPKRHLVMSTTFSRGMLYVERALPIISSDRPLEYKSDCMLKIRRRPSECGIGCGVPCPRC